MALARLSMKVGKVGKASPHAAYIARQGKYAARLDRGEKLEATEAGNMPAWAQSNPLAFWRAADEHERKNGTTYREQEIALPRELDAEQRAELVRGWAAQEIGDKHAYQWAIHTPPAADGGAQPHVHLMYSERTRDGIERDPAQYFKRANKKHPERGGCVKANTGKKPAERKAELKALRGRWEVACNAALERAGRAERIDMRSYAEQGRDEAPEPKQLPSAWRGQGKADVIEFRAAKAEQREAAAAVARTVPDAKAAVVSLRVERERRQLAELPAAGVVAVWEKVHAHTMAEVRQQADALGQRISKEAQAIDEDRKRKQEAHRQERPEAPRGALSRFKRKGHEKAMAAWSATWRSLAGWKAKRQQDLRSRWERISGYLTKRPKGVGDRAGELAAARIEHRRPQLAARVKEAQAEIEQRQKYEAAVGRVMDAFLDRAELRAERASGYEDGGRDWQAAPAKLRETIDAFNRRSAREQQNFVAHQKRNPQSLRALGRMIQAQDQAAEQARPAPRAKGPELGR